MYEETVTLVNACGDEEFQAFEQNEYMVRSNVFAQMIRLGKDLVKQHLGDFYSDAQWLRKHLNDEGEFFWACRDTGTSIGTDEKLVGFSNEHLYRVVVANDDGKWTATFTEQAITPEAG